MSDINVVTIGGHLGSDVDLVEIGDSHKASFRLGSKHIWGSGETAKEETTWVSVVCWRALAQTVAKYCVKGQEVTIVGRLVVEQYEKDGQKRNSVYIRADQIRFGRKPGQRDDSSLGKERILKLLETVSVLEENGVNRENAIEAALKNLS